MSSITLYADLLLGDLAGAQRLEQFFLAQNEDLEGDRDPHALPAEETGEIYRILTQLDCDIEEVERSESCLSVVFTGGTLQFPETELVKALDNLGAVAATIEVIDDQVGDEKRFGRHSGKKCSFTKAQRVIDESNPVCGAVRALEDGSNQRFLKLLNAGGLDPNARWRRRSLLSYACEQGVTRSALALIGAGADCAAADGRDEVWERSGRTPLHHAVTKKRNHHELINALIDGGADVEARDSEGIRPLHLAVCYGRQAFVNSLLAAGADANARSSGGFTPLLHFADSVPEEKAQILDALIQAGAQPDLTCDSGGNILWYACSDSEIRRRLEPLGVALQRPSYAYSEGPYENLLEAVVRRDIEMLPEMVAAADEQDLRKLLHCGNLTGDPDVFQAFLECDIDAVVEEVAKALFRELRCAGTDNTRERTRSLLDKVRTKWPDRVEAVRRPAEQSLACAYHPGQTR